MRLSKTIRTAILNAALAKAGIPERKSAIRQRYANWAETVRVRYVTPEALAAIEAARATISDIPKELLVSLSFNREKSIDYANVGGQRREVYFCGALVYSDRGTTRNSIISPWLRSGNTHSRRSFNATALRY